MAIRRFRWQQNIGKFLANLAPNRRQISEFKRRTEKPAPTPPPPPPTTPQQQTVVEPPRASQQILDEVRAFQPPELSGPSQEDLDRVRREEEQRQQEILQKRGGVLKERAQFLRGRIGEQQGFLEHQAGQARASLERQRGVAGQQFESQRQRIERLFEQQKAGLRGQQPGIERAAARATQDISREGEELQRRATAQRAGLGVAGLRSGAAINEQDLVRSEIIESIGDIQLNKVQTLNNIAQQISQADASKGDRIADLSFQFQEFQNQITDKFTQIDVQRIQAVSELAAKSAEVDFQLKSDLTELDLQQQEAVNNAVANYVEAVNTDNDRKMKQWGQVIDFTMDQLDAQLKLDDIASKEEIAALKAATALAGKAGKEKKLKSADVIKMAEEEFGLTRRQDEFGGFSFFLDGQQINRQEYTNAIQGSLDPTFTLRDTLKGSLNPEDVKLLSRKFKAEEGDPGRSKKSTADNNIDAELGIDTDEEV